jgi:DNA polymerase sigma
MPCRGTGVPPQVIRARVPLITFTDSQTGIAVDISVSNHGGTFKSIFTRELCQFDPRFISLYRLVRWDLAYRTRIMLCKVLLS